MLYVFEFYIQFIPWDKSILKRFNSDEFILMEIHASKDIMKFEFVSWAWNWLWCNRLDVRYFTSLENVSTYPTKSLTLKSINLFWKKCRSIETTLLIKQLFDLS